MNNTKKRGVLKTVAAHNNFSLFIVLGLLVCVLAILNPNFITYKNMMTILLGASVVGLLSIGQAYLIIGGAIDVSCGAIGALSGVTVALMISDWHMNWIVACVVVIIIGILVGAWNSLLVTKFSLQPFIATLATASICEGAGYLICGGRSISIAKNQVGFIFLGTGKISVVQLPIIFLVIFFVVFGIILAKTKFGRSIYMVGGNKTAASLAGIRPNRLLTKLYMLSGGIAAFTGLVLASRLNTGAPSAIIGSEFDAITAVVLGGVAFNGGKGNMVGCFIGLLIIQCFSNGLTVLGVSSFWQTVAQGALLVLALILDDYRNKRTLKSKIKSLITTSN